MNKHKTKKLGLAGLALMGTLTLGISGCKDYRVPVELPNGYSTTGIIEKSETHKGSYNVYSEENRLEEKSRIDGEISYVGHHNNGVIIGIRTRKMDYLFSLKIPEYPFYSSTAEKLFKEGDKVSIPTIRKYDEATKVLKAGFRDVIGDGYRILNDMDYIYPDEIQKK